MAIVGNSRPANRQSRRPYFWTLIAAKATSILPNYSRTDIGLEMAPEIGQSYPRLGPRELTPLIADTWSAISGSPRDITDGATEKLAKSLNVRAAGSPTAVRAPQGGN